MDEPNAPKPPDHNDPWGQPSQPPPGTEGNQDPPQSSEPPPYQYGSSYGTPAGSSYQPGGYDSGSYQSGSYQSPGSYQYPSQPEQTFGQPAPTYGSASTNPFPGLAIPPPRPPRRGRPMVLVAVALIAGLVGGGIGSAAGYHAANDKSSASALTAPPSSSKSTASAGSIQEVAAKVLPSVVSIDVSNLPNNANSVIPGFPGFGGGNGNGNGQSGGSDAVEGSGSGIVLSNDGLILTNNHVAGQGDLAVTFQNGRTVKAKLVEADPTTDLAVIKADGVTDAVPINFGRSADLSVGQQVVAIGSPLGLSGTVTSGIISALHRPIQPQEQSGGSGNEVNVIDGIQTDAPINPGNSGGALVDMNGNLVGITSAIATLGGGPFGGQSGSIGLGFAIPADEAKIVAAALQKNQPVAHALLGVQVASSPNLLQRGALIKGITAGGPADKAGLKKGDLVIKADDRIIDTSDALVADVRSHQPGDKVTLTYIRGNATQTVDVSLGSDANSGH
jgi:putative serine protease PepD